MISNRTQTHRFTFAENELNSIIRFEDIDRETSVYKGYIALNRLFQIAKCESHNNSLVVRKFLLSLHDGRRFPLDPSILQYLDNRLIDDCMLVLAMKSKEPGTPIASRVNMGKTFFAAFARSVGGLS